MSVRFIVPASIQISRRRSIIRAQAQGIQSYSALPEFGRPLMARLRHADGTEDVCFLGYFESRVSGPSGPFLTLEASD
jgi:hypothetical protein